MGVYRYYRWFASKEIFRSCLHRNAPFGVQVFAIDLNGVIHSNAQRVFGYGKTPKTDEELGITYIHGKISISQERYYQLEGELFEAIFNEICQLSATIRPTETLMIMVDGVAPMAKISQQRNRRYKGISTSSFNPAAGSSSGQGVSDRGAPGRKPSTDFKSKVFDSNCISPHTDFMKRLDQYLLEQFDAIRAFDARQTSEIGLSELASKLPARIIYSSHTVAGEGEHKIAEALRELPQGKRVVIHGADSDLFSIYLSQLKHGFANIYLFRNNNRDFSVDTIVDLRKLEEILTTLFPEAVSPTTDFLLLLMFIGNDFLPNFPNFERITDALDTLTAGYSEFIRSETGRSPLGLTSDNGIEWKNLAQFIKYISDRYEDLLFNRWAFNQDHLIKTQFPWIVASNLGEISSVVRGHSNLVRSFNVPKFKKEWYPYVFSPKLNQVLILTTEGDINAMIEKYLEGLAWVFTYYTKGARNINLEWYYPYFYTPIFSDIGKYILDRSGQASWLIEPIYTTTSFMNPLVQLAMIMPPTSLPLVPPKLRMLYSDTSYIADMIPTEFFFDDLGKEESFQGFVVLPKVNATRILDAFRYLGITNLDLEEAANPQRDPAANGGVLDFNRNLFNLNTISSLPSVRGRGGSFGGPRGRGRGSPRGRGGPGGNERDTFTPRGRGGSLRGGSPRGRETPFSRESAASSTSTSTATSAPPPPPIFLPETLGGGSISLEPLGLTRPMEPPSPAQRSRPRPK